MWGIFDNPAARVEGVVWQSRRSKEHARSHDPNHTRHLMPHFYVLSLLVPEAGLARYSCPCLVESVTQGSYFLIFIDQYSITQLRCSSRIKLFPVKYKPRSNGIRTVGLYLIICYRCKQEQMPILPICTAYVCTYLYVSRRPNIYWGNFEITVIYISFKWMRRG